MSGRHPSNTIQLTGRFIHKHHEVLRREPDGGYRLFDLMYRNVVMLRGQARRRATLEVSSTHS